AVERYAALARAQPMPAESPVADIGSRVAHDARARVAPRHRVEIALVGEALAPQRQAARGDAARAPPVEEGAPFRVGRDADPAGVELAVLRPVGEVRG